MILKIVNFRYLLIMFNYYLFLNLSYDFTNDHLNMVLNHLNFDNYFNFNIFIYNYQLLFFIHKIINNLYFYVE